MKKTRFTEAQIVGILRELDAGTPASELGAKARHPREHDPALARRYGGMETSDLVELKQLRTRTAAKTGSSPGWRWRSTR